MRRYFEEIEVGGTDALGHEVMDYAEIVDFHLPLRPQPKHTDETAAKDSTFGSLVASGWHTASETMRLLVHTYIADLGAGRYGRR